MHRSGREQLADASTWDFIIDVRTLTEFEGLGAGDNGYGRIPGGAGKELCLC